MCCSKALIHFCKRPKILEKKGDKYTICTQIRIIHYINVTRIFFAYVTINNQTINDWLLSLPACDLIN